MLQCFRLDRPVAPLYLRGTLAVAVVLLGCRAVPGAVVPIDIAPVSEAQVATWVGATVPPDARVLGFGWLFQDERGSVGGKGSARLAPPDSLRFDAAGQFNVKPMAAVVIGDVPRWVEPPDALEKFVPNYPLFWAMFGVARLPMAGAELRGIQTGETTAWQYALGADTMEYRYTRGQPSVLVAEARRGGSVVGRAVTRIGADGVPLGSKLIVPSAPAKLDLTFTSTKRTTFAPDIWIRRDP